MMNIAATVPDLCPGCHRPFQSFSVNVGLGVDGEVQYACESTWDYAKGVLVEAARSSKCVETEITATRNVAEKHGEIAAEISAEKDVVLAAESVVAVVPGG